MRSLSQVKQFGFAALITSGIFVSCENHTTSVDEALKVPVVEGYLYANEPVREIRIFSIVPFEEPNPEPQKLILNGQVKLHEGSNVYDLEPNEDGFYENDHIVQEGKTYTLKFTYGDNRVEATTIVPVAPKSLEITKQRFILDTLRRLVLDRGDTIVLGNNDTLIHNWSDTTVVVNGRAQNGPIIYGTPKVINSADTIVIHSADTLHSDSLPTNNQQRRQYTDTLKQGEDLYLIKPIDTVSIANRSMDSTTTPGDTVRFNNADTVTFAIGDTLIHEGSAIALDSIRPIIVETGNVTRQLRFGTLPTLKWEIEDSVWTYMHIENIDSLPVDIIRDSSAIQGRRGNFRFTGEPSRADSLRVQTQMIEQYGKHHAVVYRVNAEYQQLWSSSRQQARSEELFEPATNVINGMGVFTAFSGDTATFVVDSLVAE